MAAVDTNKEKPLTAKVDLLSLGLDFSKEPSKRLRDVFLSAGAVVMPPVYLN